VNERITSKDTTFYHRGIIMLPERWKEVAENGGNYFDEDMIHLRNKLILETKKRRALSLTPNNCV